jgi:sulfite exporter TauE/SafE
MVAEAVLEGVLLGLSSGLFCLASCAPALVPFIMGEDRRLRGTAGALAGITAGRFAAYMLVGGLVGAAASALQGPLLTTVSSIAMIALAVVLIAFSLRGSETLSCLCTFGKLPAAGMPVAVGFLTGISPCPPFLLAISRAAALGSLVSGIGLFAGFFAGTSVYLLLFVPLGCAGRYEQVRTIGRIAAVIAGIFYLVIGVIGLL